MALRTSRPAVDMIVKCSDSSKKKLQWSVFILLNSKSWVTLPRNPPWPAEAVMESDVNLWWMVKESDGGHQLQPQDQMQWQGLCFMLHPCPFIFPLRNRALLEPWGISLMTSWPWSVSSGLWQVQISPETHITLLFERTSCLAMPSEARGQAFSVGFFGLCLPF